MKTKFLIYFSFVCGSVCSVSYSSACTIIPSASCSNGLTVGERIFKSLKILVTSGSYKTPLNWTQLAEGDFPRLGAESCKQKGNQYATLIEFAIKPAKYILFHDIVYERIDGRIAGRKVYFKLVELSQEGTKSQTNKNNKPVFEGTFPTELTAAEELIKAVNSCDGENIVFNPNSPYVIREQPAAVQLESNAESNTDSNPAVDCETFFGLGAGKQCNAQQMRSYVEIQMALIKAGKAGAAAGNK